MKEKLSDIITYSRKRKGLSQEALGKKIGVSPATINKWERQGVPVPFERIQGLASNLDRNPFDLARLTFNLHVINKSVNCFKEIEPELQLFPELQNKIKEIQEKVRFCIAEVVDDCLDEEQK
jgi:transcriptional regulator with XRE-family HTH domain